MANRKAAWGIEIGAHAIKGIRLERTGDSIEVSDFAVIPHTRVLTTPDLDADEMVRLSLGQFIAQKTLEGEHLVMTVPGHAAFARFAKLPPVEPKKVPDIVKFEAVQQIPFPIEDVEWDYQTFSSEDTPEIEVGIFAITRQRVQERLGLYGELGLTPEALTLSPLGVYNAMVHDLDLNEESEPVVFIDIGTQATDVIVADEGRCWIRSFPLGGTHFTEAIADAFKLSYSKAEKLKQEAATSKYAKQIMQAMRPVFSDLLQDLQRSLGYYQSLHRDRELKNMVGLGSTMKIAGLRKFLGQQLQISVSRLDEYRKLRMTGREAASFAEHSVNMASAYGAALQGVGLAPIAANLVPVKILREQLWAGKTKYFAAAAAIVVIGGAMTLWRPLADAGVATDKNSAEVTRVLRTGGQLVSELEQAKMNGQAGFVAANVRGLLDQRRVWPYLLHDVADAVASGDPQSELLEGNLAQVMAIAPEDRRLVSLVDLSGDYVPPTDADKRRRISVKMTVDVTHAEPDVFLNGTIKKWLTENGEPIGNRSDAPYRIIADTVSINPGLAQALVWSEGTVDSDGSATVSGGPGGGRGGGGNVGGGRGGGGNVGGGRGGGGNVGGGRGGGGNVGGGRGGGGNVGGGRGGGGNVGGGRGGGSGVSTPGMSGGNMNGGGRAGNAGSTGTTGSTDSGAAAGSTLNLDDGEFDIDAMAPIIGAASPYLDGTKFKRFPITFEIELLTPQQIAAAKKKANGTPAVNSEGTN
ncbi:MAG: type IV pilus assembly protein PilM [Phycisphaerales bacterium]|nr:type IV pilus assembly protein PilM [Phycisphaerales bacterium]